MDALSNDPRHQVHPLCFYSERRRLFIRKVFKVHVLRARPTVVPSLGAGSDTSMYPAYYLGT